MTIAPPEPAFRRPRSWLRRHFGDPLARVLLGRLPGPGGVLEVQRPGGRLRSIPLSIWRRDDVEHIVALFGHTPWVRDLRAGATIRLQRRGRSYAVQLEELSRDAAAEFLAWYVTAYRGPARIYLGVREPSVSLEESQRLAQRHPVFRLLREPGPKPA
jgi:hypothetical protein